MADEPAPRQYTWVGGGGQNAPVELAILELRKSVEVGFAKVDGQLALVLQRTEQAERRADQHDRAIEELEDRMAAVERDQVTRAEMDERARRTLMILGLILTAAAIVVAAGVSLLVAVIAH